MAQTKMSWRSLLTSTPRDQGSELSTAMMIPQMTALARGGIYKGHGFKSRGNNTYHCCDKGVALARGQGEG